MSIAAAEYPSVEPRRLLEGKLATVDDICDFVVEYIHSDVLVRVMQLLVYGNGSDYSQSL
jgi:hypothetical protein